MTVELSWMDVQNKAAETLSRKPTRYYGIPRGGSLLVSFLAHVFPQSVIQVWKPVEAQVILDDIICTGKTLEAYEDAVSDLIQVCALYSQSDFNGQWVSFPWERHPVEGIKNSESHDAVTRLLQYIGEDPLRNGLIDTPSRVCRYLKEMTCGYEQDPAAILSKTFEIDHDQMITMQDIDFTSLCEHHMLPFFGTATIAYIPFKPSSKEAKAKVVGISKLARLVECFARRLQTQERLTDQIAEALLEHLDPIPIGVGVTLRAVHGCMACRGVNKRITLVTTALRGVIRDDSGARSEYLQLAVQK